MKRTWLVLALAIGLSKPVAAEFASVSEVVEPLIPAVAKALEGRAAVVVPQAAGVPIFWSPQQAFAIEFVRLLAAHNVDAIHCLSDPRTSSLAKLKRKIRPADSKLLAEAGRDALLVVTLTTGRRPSLEVLAMDEMGTRLLFEKATVPIAALSLEANTPDSNRQVIDFCLKNMGVMVGNGECSTLAESALEAASAPRHSVYTWGRQLGEYEPVLPGDIIQIERGSLKWNGGSRKFDHHTAIVERVTSEGLMVLHQNVGSAGKVVQRGTWPAQAVRTGHFVAFRPGEFGNGVPRVLPRRRLPPKVVWSGKSVDLLKTLDPNLDTVQGICFFERGALTWNRDAPATCQLPVTLPPSYSLTIKVERVGGQRTFGIGVVVGGHRALIAMDAFGGTVSGIDMVNGRRCNSNETTKRGAVLPEGKEVEIQVAVTPDSIRCKLDGEELIHWQGDPSALAIHKDFATPNQLPFVTAWNSQLKITQILLARN